jgi:DNA-binding MarR family transcriptional regulator
VAEADGINQMGIVNATGIDRSTTAELVRRMMQRGLLQRRRDRRDTRAYIVSLTAEGEQLLERLRPAAARVDEVLLGKVPRAERMRLLAALEGIVANAHSGAQ